MKINELKLFGEPYKINDYIILNHPTLKDIRDTGEDEYYSFVKTITSTSYDFRVPLYDMGIDYEELDDFQMFINLYKGFSKDESKVIFGELNLQNFILTVNKETEDIVLLCHKSLAFKDEVFDEEDVVDLYEDVSKDKYESDYVRIDKSIYTQIVSFIRAINLFKREFKKGGNKAAKKYIIEKEKRRLEREAKKAKDDSSVLTSLIFSLVNCSHFKYDFTSVLDLPIFVFNRSVRQIQNLKNYDLVMGGVYSGMIDTSKMSLDDIQWLNNPND